MAEQLKSLKVGSEVYVKSWNAYGKVLHVVPGDEAEEEKAYKIQITRFFRRTDLEPYDAEAEREKREAARREKIQRSESAIRRWQDFAARNGDMNSPEAIQLGLEVLRAASAVAREFDRSTT